MAIRDLRDFVDLLEKHGEAQRIRLATQIGSRLVGVLYILDEPSIGLHQRDNARLLATLKRLRDLGNTVLVVEHDEETIRAADHLIDLGPGAGKHGGEVIASGTVDEVLRNPGSITAQYLNGTRRIAMPAARRARDDRRVVPAMVVRLDDVGAEPPPEPLEDRRPVHGSPSTSGPGRRSCPGAS